MEQTSKPSRPVERTIAETAPVPVRISRDSELLHVSKSKPRVRSRLTVETYEDGQMKLSVMLPADSSSMNVAHNLLDMIAKQKM